MLVPFALLFALGGLYLTIRLRLYRFPYNFLGIKLLSGTLDWKAKKGKLSPVEAISAGSGYQMTVGALLGGILAYVLAGPGILFWIWVSCFLVMPFDFVAGNLSNRARLKGPRNVPLLGPARYIHQGLRGRWLAFLFAVLFIITALIMGGAFPVVVAHHYMQTVFPISAASLGISLGILWIFMVAGGIRRIGVAARYTVSYSGVIAIVALVLLFVSLWFVQDFRATRINILDFFGHAIHTIIPGSRIDMVQKAMGVITFWVLTGNAGGTLATLTGAIRTNFPAKAGLASMPSAMIAAFLFAPIAVYLGWAFYAELDTARLLERVLNNPGHSSQWVGYISALALLGFSLAALGGWSYAGQQAARFLGGTIPATAFYIMFLITIIGTGLLLELDRIGFVEILAVSMIWFMFSTIINVVATIMQTGAARADLMEYMESDQARMTISRDFLLLFFHLLPKNLVSRLFGYFSMFHFPRIVRLPLLRWFARTYKIDLAEAEKPLEEYASLNQFFTRALKPGIRPVHQSRDGVVSPVDGVLSRMGYINDGFMVQAKGIMYSLEDLLEGSEQTHLFEGGTYCVLY
ncbi:MAG: alanine:cation symporter family protein, partial [Leptospiraceae bacterium]|nr:alanine:cation symporter family protein [Leptospiraceae bacterium]